MACGYPDRPNHLLGLTSPGNPARHLAPESEGQAQHFWGSACPPTKGCQVPRRSCGLLEPSCPREGSCTHRQLPLPCGPLGLRFCLEPSTSCWSRKETHTHSAHRTCTGASPPPARLSVWQGTRKWFKFRGSAARLHFLFIEGTVFIVTRPRCSLRNRLPLAVTPTPTGF